MWFYQASYFPHTPVIMRNKISVKQEKVCSTRFQVMSVTKILETCIRSFPSSPHGCLYGRLCRTRVFCLQDLSGPQCYLSSFQLFKQKRWSRGRFNGFLPLLVKDPFVQKFKAVSMVGFLLKKANLSTPHRPSTCAAIFLFVDAASLWRAEIVKASLPEVNQFTGNCFRMVRIVLKITCLGLRYPGQRPECPSLSYYGS